MSGEKKKIDPLLSLERIFENCGCRGRNADPEEWVFPRGERGHEKAFSAAYCDLARSMGELAPENPHSGLFFRRGVEGESRTGDQAEGAFFSSFSFLVDYFAQPENAQELGNLLRQFLSKYCGEQVLEGVDKARRREAGLAEEALVKFSGDNHAYLTDTLRLLYNGSMATLLGDGVGKKIGAVQLGENGRKLTPIGTPRALAMALEREEAGTRGSVYCVDARTGRCYERGGWTEGEWIEAVARVEAESGGSEAAKNAGLRALDAHYFPEKVAGAVARRFNLVAELKDDALIHCRQGTTFSSLRLAARLGADLSSRGSEGRGRAPDITEDYGDFDEARYLPAPSSFEEALPDEAGLEAVEVAAAKGGADRPGDGAKGKVQHTGDRAEEGGAEELEGRKQRARKPALDRTGRAVNKFLRTHPEAVKEGGREQLRAIFEGGQIGPDDYISRQGCFVSVGTGALGESIPQWRKKTGEAMDQEEAGWLGRRLIRKGGGRSGAAIPGDGGVYLVQRQSGKETVKWIDGANFDNKAKTTRGKISIDGAVYLPAGEVKRIPYGEAVLNGAEEERGKPLSRPGAGGVGSGGILGALRRVFRGGK